MTVHVDVIDVVRRGGRVEARYVARTQLDRREFGVGHMTLVVSPYIDIEIDGVAGLDER